jgi:hypothetical protein
MDMPPPLPPSAPTRPTSVTAIAIIGIVLALMGIVCTPLGALPYFMQFGPPNPMIDMVKDNTLLYAWTMLSLLLGFFLAIALMAGSIGALMLKPWARLTLIAYAGLAMAFGLVGAIVQFAVMMPMARTLDPAMASGAMIGMSIGGGCICLALLYQASILYVMTRPDVKQLFDGR